MKEVCAWLGKLSTLALSQRLKSRVREWGYTGIWYGKLRGCDVMCRYVQVDFSDLGKVKVK